MTIEAAWKLLVYIGGGFLTLKAVILPIWKKIKEKNEKIERGANLDDQYVNDHEIIVKMADTVERIDKKLDKDIILTLRNTIMNPNLTIEERLEAYYDYKKMGGNGEVKKYAETHLIKN